MSTHRRRYGSTRSTGYLGGKGPTPAGLLPGASRPIGADAFFVTEERLTSTTWTLRPTSTTAPPVGRSRLHRRTRCRSDRRPPRVEHRFGFPGRIADAEDQRRVEPGHGEQISRLRLLRAGRHRTRTELGRPGIAYGRPRLDHDVSAHRPQQRHFTLLGRSSLCAQRAASSSSWPGEESSGGAGAVVPSGSSSADGGVSAAGLTSDAGARNARARITFGPASKTRTGHPCSAGRLDRPGQDKLPLQG